MDIPGADCRTGESNSSNHFCDDGKSSSEVKLNRMPQDKAIVIGASLVWGYK